MEVLFLQVEFFRLKKSVILKLETILFYLEKAVQVIIQKMMMKAELRGFLPMIIQIVELQTA